MSIRTRILLSMFLCTLVVLLPAGWALTQLFSSMNEYQEIMEDTSPEIAYLCNMKSLLVGGLEQEEVKTRFLEMLQGYKDHAHDEGEKTFPERIDRLFHQSTNLSQQTKGLHQLIDEALLEELAEIEEAQNYARLDKQRVQNWVLLATLASLVIAFGLGVVLSGYLTRPLLDLDKATKEFAHGERRVLDTSRGDEIGDLARAFNQMSQELEHNTIRRDQLEELITERTRDLELSQRSQETLSRLIVHDLNGYLTALKLEARRLEKSGGAPSSISDTLKDMEDLVSSILDTGRLERGELPFQKENFHLPPLLRSLCERNLDLALSRGITLELEEGELPNLNSDRVLVGRILQNLVQNALHHGPQNATVSIHAHFHDGVFIVKVLDQGSNLLPENLDHIFEKHVRLDPNRPGLGLGLTFCRLAAKRLGGEVLAQVSSKTQTVFSLRLPVRTNGKDS